MLKHKKIFITGGAGFLGKALIERLYSDNDICIYSRDEAKHYFLKKKYPNIKCIVGSITDKDRLIRSAKGYEIGIFAASLKQISACDENPIESINTISIGAINSRTAAEDNNFEAACFISTDKACEATTIYGACKYVAEQSFIVGDSGVKLTSCRYGNVTNSTGSVIPLIKNNIANDTEAILYSDTMTRFMINRKDAVDLVLYSLNKAEKVVVVPKLKSFLVKDLFDLYKEFHKLKYIIKEPRVGEKIHEIMIGKEELQRTTFTDNHFFISPQKNLTTMEITEPYSSDNHIMSKDELYQRMFDEQLI